jgi:hypothetical protein
MRTALTFICLTGSLFSQDIAPKDAERDPVLTALLEDSEFIEVANVELEGGAAETSEPVLVTGNPPSDAKVIHSDENYREPDELPAAEESPESTTEPKGVRVEVEGGTATSTFRAEEIRLLAPFPAKPLANPPSGWQLEHPKDAPPLSKKVKLANGSELVLSIRPHVLVPSSDGSNVFSLSEPGYDASEGYSQTKTVGSILADSIHQLDEQGDRLGTAARRLSELLDSLPPDVPTDSASTTTDS